MFLALLSVAKLSSLLLPTGGFYCGPLDVDDQPHGDGSLHRADGSMEVNGQWVAGRLIVSGERDTEGRLHGAGSERSVLGLYSGAFEHGSRSGLGSLTLSDGRVYEGEWAGGKLSGFGIQWDEDGKIAHCGLWENDQLIETCAVPRTKIPVGAQLSVAGQPWTAHAPSVSWGQLALSFCQVR